MASITLKEYLKGRDVTYSKDYEPYKDNALKTVETINKFLANYNSPLIVSSGFRPAKLNNSTYGAASKSNHIICLACDIQDMGSFPLMNYVLKNLQLAKDLGIYFEDFRATPSWVHMQIISPNSGKRIFKPNSSNWLAPQKWNGNYDSKYNSSPA